MASMSIRTGYSLGYDFINAQFHLNTSSVAPPFNAEARVTNPAGGFDDPWRGTGNENVFPFTVGPNSVFPLTGPYISLPPDIKPPRQQSWNLGVQRQIGNDMAVSATYIGSYSDRLWNVRSLNQGVYIPGSCTLQTATGPQFFPVCSVNTNLDQRRGLTMADYADGKYLGAVDEHTALGIQKYHGLLLSVQRRLVNGFSVSAQLHVEQVQRSSERRCCPTSTPVTSTRTTSTTTTAPCDSDRRHLFNLTASAETPRFDNAVVRALASDWRLSGLFRAYSGSPLSVTVTGDPARTGIGGQRADQVLDDPYGDRTT